MRLLARLLPFIYGDPQRLRRCKGCGRKNDPGLMQPYALGWVCNDECRVAAWENDLV